MEDATAKGFENIDEDTDAILASLDAEGADWQAIMADKNQDTGMDSHPNGYAVSADMSGFDAAFVEAAMALAKPGDHSGKVKGQYGYYIIRYDSDEVEGPAALADVKENISSALLKSKNIAAVPGTAFGPGGEGNIRCCYATALDKLNVALDRIAEFVKEHT